MEKIKVEEQIAECTRCRHKHKISERVDKPLKILDGQTKFAQNAAANRIIK